MPSLCKCQTANSKGDSIEDCIECKANEMMINTNFSKCMDERKSKEADQKKE